MTELDNAHIVWHSPHVSQEAREAIKHQRGCVLWFTGLSGSGKSTLANALEQQLNSKCYHTYLLDGDNIRHGLNGDLGFSDTHRVENIRRIGEVSRLFVDAGIITLVAFISPFTADRTLVRSLLGERFIEIYVDTPLAICEQRDPKGLYQKARAGKLINFTGVDSVYETPLNPDLVISTHEVDLPKSVDLLEQLLYKKGIIPWF